MTPTLIICPSPTEAARIATARGMADGMWLHFSNLVSAGNYAHRVGLRFGVTVDLVVAGSNGYRKPNGCGIVTEAGKPGACYTESPLSHRSELAERTA